MKRDADKRKQEIGEVAIKLFLKQGVQGTSIREIALSLGVSKSTIFHYFRTKDEIIDMVAKNSAQYVDRIREYYWNLGNISPAEALRRCIIKFLTSSNWRNILFINREFRSLSPIRAEALTLSVRQFVGFFEHLLDEGIRTGEFKIKDPGLIAFTIWSTQQEMVLRHWLLKENYTNEDFAEKEADFILSAIRVSKTEPVAEPDLVN